MVEVAYQQMRTGELYDLWKNKHDREAGNELFRRLEVRLRDDPRVRMRPKGLAWRTTELITKALANFFDAARRDTFMWRGSRAFLNYLLATVTNILKKPPTGGGPPPLDGKDLPGREADPADIAEQEDYMKDLLTHVKEDTRKILELTLQGCTINEVAEESRCSIATIKRKLKGLRKMPCFKRLRGVRD